MLAWRQLGDFILIFCEALRRTRTLNCHMRVAAPRNYLGNLKSQVLLVSRLMPHRGLFKILASSMHAEITGSQRQ